MARKEWLIAIRYPSWVLAIFLWPLLLPLGFIFGGRAMAGPGGESLAVFQGLTGTADYAGYVVVGTILWMWVNMALWDSGYFFRQEQLRGTLDSNWMTPAPRLAHLLGSALVSLLTGVVTATIAIAEFRLALGLRIAGSPWLIALSVAAMLPSVYGLSLLFASVVVWAKDISTMVQVVRGTFLIFCGVSYPLAVLPGWMRSVASALPMTYAIDAVRKAALTRAEFRDIRGDLTVLLVYGFALFICGILAFNYTDRQARRLGSLAHY
ncbi:MAG: ABC transporter permease [Bacillota bacterium]